MIFSDSKVLSVYSRARISQILWNIQMGRFSGTQTRHYVSNLNVEICRREHENHSDNGDFSVRVFIDLFIVTNGRVSRFGRPIKR